MAASTLPSHGSLLLGVARDSLEQTLEQRPGRLDRDRLAARHPWLAEPGAAFVTLHEEERLRGCVGSVVATRPLFDDVRQNAQSAALRDPRFPPLGAGELARVDIEVSVLSTPQAVSSCAEEEVLSLLRPGVDGLLLTYRGHRATLLPQVWESISDPREFLACLKQKAGLGADFWHGEIRLERYRILAWSEADHQAAPGKISV